MLVTGERDETIACTDMLRASRYLTFRSTVMKTNRNLTVVFVFSYFRRHSAAHNSRTQRQRTANNWATGTPRAIQPHSYKASSCKASKVIRMDSLVTSKVISGKSTICATTRSNYFNRLSDDPHMCLYMVAHRSLYDDCELFMF